MLTLKYLCLQATQEGQASYAHVHEIINCLKKRGWDVELFEPSYARENISPSAFKRMLEFIYTQFRLWRKIDKNDIIYIRSHFAAFFTAFIAKIRRIYVVQEVNGPYEDLFVAWPWTRCFKKLFKCLIKMQYKWADAIIVVTPQLKEWIIREIGNHQIYIIPNGANTELFNPNAVSKYQLQKPYVVFFGVLAPWQGVDTMLKAVENNEWPNEVKLVIMGDGVEKPKIEKVAKKNKKVVYLGKIPYIDVPGIVANSIGGLSPQNNINGRSSTGLSPLKVYEMLACGIPIIVTDFPGQADLVIDNKCGLVIPPEDPEALAKAVKYLYKNKEISKEFGMRGRDVILKEHSWDKRAEETERVLVNMGSSMKF